MLLKEGIYKASVIDRIVARIAGYAPEKKNARDLSGLCYSLGELLDRYAIEVRKFRYGADNGNTLTRAQKALRVWMGKELFPLVDAAVNLGLANADIANLEWQIREGRQLPLEEIGRRALLIRRINDWRVLAKNRATAVVEGERETRLYGYGPDFPAEKATLAVQEIAECAPPKN